MANDYFNFRNPVIPGTRIVSARYNQDLSTIAAAFDQLPGSSDLFLSLLGFGPSTGTTPNVYNVTIPVAAPLTAYVAGMQVTFLADKTSTGAAQLNVNGLGNKLIVSSGNVGLPSGSIIAGSYYTLRYDGVNFQMQTALYALFDRAAAAAQVSASAASASAAAAAASASSAADSASSASSSAATATARAADALAYRNTAQSAAGTASTSATNAANSATAAAGSAQSAATSATNAATSEANALAYRNTAQSAAANASTSATNAANSATAAANSAASISLPLPITSGGTGATSRATALSNLLGAQPLPITQGGTGATTDVTARSALGLKTAAVYDVTGTMSAGSAIIESGVTGSGSYIKFADGTLICWFNRGTIDVTSAARTEGGLAFYWLGYNWVFPAQFFDITKVSVLTQCAAWGSSGGTGAGAVVTGSSLSNLTSSGATLRIYAMFQFASISPLTLTAIGTWK